MSELGSHSTRPERCRMDSLMAYSLCEVPNALSEVEGNRTKNSLWLS